MDREDREVDNLEHLEFLLRDVQIPPDMEGTDILKPEKSKSLWDFFWSWSGLEDFSGLHRIKCLFYSEDQTSNDENRREATTVFSGTHTSLTIN